MFILFTSFNLVSEKSALFGARGTKYISVYDNTLSINIQCEIKFVRTGGRYINDTKSSEKVLSTIHPLMLSKHYLNLRYSQNAIKLLLDNRV